VDETATGSANLFFAVPFSCASRICLVHFRPPSIDKGVTAFIWGLGLGLYIYFGLIAIGSSGAFAIVIAMVAAAGIWLFVRLRGEDNAGV
jgi:hypothetical protein